MPASELSKAELARFGTYAWPGNVRQLRNAVARSIALGDVSMESDAHWMVDARASQPPEPGGVASADVIDRVLDQGLPLIRGRCVVVAEYERRYIQRVLDAHGGNVARSARASGIARRYFQKLRSRSGV